MALSVYTLMSRLKTSEGFSEFSEKEGRLVFGLKWNTELNMTDSIAALTHRLSADSTKY